MWCKEEPHPVGKIFPKVSVTLYLNDLYLGVT